MRWKPGAWLPSDMYTRFAPGGGQALKLIMGDQLKADQRHAETEPDVEINRIGLRNLDQQRNGQIIFLHLHIGQAENGRDLDIVRHIG